MFLILTVSLANNTDIVMRSLIIIPKRIVMSVRDGNFEIPRPHIIILCNGITEKSITYSLRKMQCLLTDQSINA